MTTKQFGNNGYLQVGHGPKRVIGLSGWLGGSDGWGSMFDAIDPEAFTFVLMDYRGYGRSRDLAGDYGFAESARDVVALADRLGWERFSLMGHSMGGVAIQRVLLEAPGRVDKLVGLSPVPACSSKMDEGRLGFFLAAVGDVAVREKVFAFSTGGRLAPVWARRMAEATMKTIVPEAFAAYLREWATVDFSDSVRGLANPVKLFVGENDPTLTADLMRGTWLDYYPNASVETVANAGHYPMCEAPLAVGTQVAAFLAD